MGSVLLPLEFQTEVLASILKAPVNWVCVTSAFWLQLKSPNGRRGQGVREFITLHHAPYFSQKHAEREWLKDQYTLFFAPFTLSIPFFGLLSKLLLLCLCPILEVSSLSSMKTLGVQLLLGIVVVEWTKNVRWPWRGSGIIMGGKNTFSP